MIDVMIGTSLNGLLYLSHKAIQDESHLPRTTSAAVQLMMRRFDRVCDTLLIPLRPPGTVFDLAIVLSDSPFRVCRVSGKQWPLLSIQ
jgi:hypothetical protein